jgi:hypothetical protein
MKKLDRILSAIFLAALCLAGCIKHNEPATASSKLTDSLSQNALVVTPAGMLPRAHVHHIGSGYRLARQNGHIVKTKIGSSTVVEDLGSFRPIAVKRKANPAPGSLPFVVNPGWVTFAQWQNTSSSPITNLTSNWVVPSLPTTDDGQTIYIFNGLQLSDGSDVLQPVLQYGSSNAGDPNGWGIANWFVWTDNNGLTQAGWSDLLPVSPGTNLQGVVSLLGQNPDGSYHYTSSFTGYPNLLDIDEDDSYPSGSVASAVSLQTEGVITLETYHNDAYSVAQASDYPAGQNFIDINNIGTSLGGSPSSASWIVYNNNTPFQESTQVILDNTVLYGFPPGNTRTIPGDVRIYFHAVPLVNNSTVNLGFTPSSPATATITGYPGGLVYVLLFASATATTYATSTFTLSTPGVTFTDGTTNLSVTRSNSVGTSQVIKSFYMPPGGSITGNCTQVSNNPTGRLSLIPPGELQVY